MPTTAKHTRYFGSYLETIRRCVNKATTEYIWVVASVCDYNDFDFNWKPAPWEAKQIHCWASDKQHQGDTFLIPVEEFKKQEPLEKLEWFADVHYHHPGVKRFGIDVIYTSNMMEGLQKIDQYYTVVSVDTEEWVQIRNTQHAVGLDASKAFVSPSLWGEKAIYPLNKSGSAALVPIECKSKINDQLYDYPHISYDFAERLSDIALDIVFIDNGEKNALKHYEHLCEVTQGDRNRVRHVNGINGRTQAYQAAASMSQTQWFFAVFAKCEINPEFDWEWQPDHFQAPKHYIFHAKNPVNDLEYGHMGVIAYNRDLVMNPPNEIGLDFTLSAPHAVIPELSCVARYDTSPYDTWRTAFREALKLQVSYHDNYTIETEYRLHKWKTVGNGQYGEWSIRGAEDAVKYYEDSKGDPAKLKFSYEWDWLNNYFQQKY